MQAIPFSNLKVKEHATFIEAFSMQASNWPPQESAPLQAHELTAEELAYVTREKQIVNLGWGFEVMAFGKVIHPARYTTWVRRGATRFFARIYGQTREVKVTRYTYFSDYLGRETSRLFFSL